MKEKVIKLVTIINPVLGSKLFYYTKFKKRLRLDNPISFNEKLMYIKLFNYNNNRLVWECSDKYRVRDYALKHGLKDKNLTKIISVFKDVDEIDFKKLPNKFALKCSHGCGFNIICTDINKLDQEIVKKQLKKWLKTKFGYETAEVHYNHVKPVIICEEFIENKDNKYPVDYKLYCFHGKVEVVLVCKDREKEYTTHFYDKDWNKIILRDNQENNDIEKPKSFMEMINYAEELSKEFPFVRVDFYEMNNTPILGEMTFTPAACVGNYTEEGDKYLSSFLKIKEGRSI